MSIRSITRAEFDTFKPLRAPAAALILDEMDWFADDAGVVLGFIARDQADHNYFVGVLGRDEGGTFRAIDVNSGIVTLDEARSELIAKMEKALATGKTVYPGRVSRRQR